MHRLALLILLVSAAIAAPAFAEETSFTLYELLRPTRTKFAITYDVTQTKGGGGALLQFPSEPGSIATKEKVLARASGKELQFEVVSGKDAKASGLLSEKTAGQNAQFIRVAPSRAPLPKGGEDAHPHHQRRTPTPPRIT